MTHQLRQSLVRLSDPVLHLHIPEPNTQGQGVDENPQCPICPGAPLHSAQEHGAEHDILTICNTPQHLSPGPVEQACCADSQCPGLVANTVTHKRLQPLLH